MEQLSPRVHSSSFDRTTAEEHAKAVVVLSRRVSSIALTLLLLAGNIGVCAGWGVTSEARMACCSEGGDCPMHHRVGHHSQAANPITQAQADSCCASSERDHSNQSSPTFIVVISNAVLGPGVVVPVTPPALVLSDAWRTGSPIPSAPIRKHVLLSVFLV